MSISVKLTPKQIQKLEKVRTIIRDAPQNKTEDIAELISLKEIVAQSSFTKDLFIDLENAKQDIAKVFNKLYFDGQAEYYYIGEVLSINDEFIDLADIKYALENNISEDVLFKYLSKDRNFDLAEYCLGKLGRKEKIKQGLKKCKENVNYAWEQLQEHLEANKGQ